MKLYPEAIQNTTEQEHRWSELRESIQQRGNGRFIDDLIQEVRNMVPQTGSWISAYDYGIQKMEEHLRLPHMVLQHEISDHPMDGGCAYEDALAAQDVYEKINAV